MAVRKQVCMTVLPMAPEDADALIDTRAASGQWWVITSLNPRVVEVLSLIETLHFEGKAKLDLQVFTGLPTPRGPFGLVILAKKSHMNAEQLAAVLREVGMPISFEVLEQRDLLLLTTQEETDWLIAGITPAIMLLIGSKMAVPDEPRKHGEPDRSRGMYSRMIGVQYSLFGVAT